MPHPRPSAPPALAPLLAALLLGGALTACGGGDPGPAAVRKVIVLTVDTLRADQLGTYGNSTYPTPNLDRLAGQSVVFEHAYSQASLTVPSLSSMFTGLLPLRHGIHDQRSALAPNVVPLPVLLKTAGLATASFLTNICVLQPTQHTIFHDGWDVRSCSMDEEVDQYLWDEDVVNRAIQWLSTDGAPADAGDGFLCWVHLMDPHAEHRPNPADWDYEARPVLEKFEQYRAFNKWEEERTFPSAEEAQELWDLYAAEVIGADRQVGRLLDYLDTRPDGEEIAVVFAADHGEELYESWSRYDHGLSLSEGVTWVPLMVRAPGHAPRRVAEPVELLQVTPTILELTDRPVPYLLDGKSLLDPEPSRGFAISCVGTVALTMRTPEHRYWHRSTQQPWTREEAPWRAEAPWFQNRETLARYPHEKATTVEYANLADPAARRVADRLRPQLLEFVNGLGRLPELSTIQDPGLRKELAKLGYIDYGSLEGAGDGE